MTLATNDGSPPEASQETERPEPIDPRSVLPEYGTPPTLVARMPGRICYAIGDPYQGVRIDLSDEGPDKETRAEVRGAQGTQWARDLYQGNTASVQRIGGRWVWVTTQSMLPTSLQVAS